MTSSVQVPDGFSFWPIDTPEEEKNLSELLSSDFESLGIQGVIMSAPKLTCGSCGKTSGFDDIISTALRMEIHTKGFLSNIIKNRLELPTTDHETVFCYTCGEKWADPPPSWGKSSKWLVYKAR